MFAGYATRRERRLVGAKALSSRLAKVLVRLWAWEKPEQVRAKQRRVRLFVVSARPVRELVPVRELRVLETPTMPRANR